MWDNEKKGLFCVLNKKKEAAIWERQPLTKKKINELYFANMLV
jgi:hypothetical protein